MIGNIIMIQNILTRSRTFLISLYAFIGDISSFDLKFSRALSPTRKAIPLYFDKSNAGSMAKKSIGRAPKIENSKTSQKDIITRKRN